MIENEAACHFWESRGDFVTRGGQQTGAQGGQRPANLFSLPKSQLTFKLRGRRSRSVGRRIAAGIRARRRAIYGLRIASEAEK